MPLAARVGDLTSHGTPLGPGVGSINVLIGGQPAWRAQVDVHACPLVTGVVPHVGGVASRSAAYGVHQQFPAARQGDKIVEAGPPNAIAAGFPTVFIGG